MYTNRACIRRRGGKLLSYQVISTENCLRMTESKGFAVFACGRLKETHGSVYKQAKKGYKPVYALKKTAINPLYENSENSTKKQEEQK